MINATTCLTECTGVVCKPQPEPLINTTGGWVRPTRAGWALPPHVPLGDDVAPGMAQTMARSKARPVSVGLLNGQSNVTDSSEAVKKYGG
jgi:hypothetical protein